MTTRNPQHACDRPADAVIRPHAPEPGSPLQPGAAGNPYGASPGMPEGQPVDSNTADRQKAASEQAVHPGSTGNEDPGSEVEGLREERERTIRQREQP